MILESGKNLKEWRKKNHLTQQQLAERTGYSKDRISHIEAEDSPVSSKLKRYVQEIDDELHPAPPKPPLLVTTWQQVMENNAKRNNFFNKELDKIEQNISRILANIPNGYDKTIAYLSMIECWTNTLIEMLNLPYTTEEEYKKSLNSPLTKFKKSVFTYKKQYGNGK